jgi:hypothetical protein
MEALPAGDEKRAGIRCYFCDRCAQETKGSKRGRKRVRFHRCRCTQPQVGGFNAQAAAAERTETLQRVERPLQSRRQLQAAVASLRELTRQAPPAEGPGSSRDRNGLLAPLY